MARLDPQRREIALNLRRNRAADNELTAVQARLFVRSLQLSWQVPPIFWGEQDSELQLADARRLLHAASVLAEIDGPTSSDAIACYRRAAELLEWLTRSKDDITRDVPVSLLAAGAYQMAGLPAMASSLLRLAPSDGIAGPIISSFLRADFDAVLQATGAFWSENPALTGRAGSTILLAGDEREIGSMEEGAEPSGLQTNNIGRYMIAETVRSLGLFAEAVRTANHSRVEQALAKMSALRNVATRLTSDELWILFTLLEASAREFAKNSIHKRVARLTEQAPAQQQRMWRFAREQFARGRGILWTSQVQGLDRLAEHSSFALCTPTGSGKTLVANLALVKELLLVQGAPGSPAPLALYLVPSRALAGEVERKLAAELGRDVLITGLYGGTDWGITDNWLTTEQPVVLIATVEKAEALLRYVGHLLIRRMKLLIIDEAHQVVSAGNDRARRELADHTSRAMRLEAMVSRLLTLKPDLARIALTAVAGGAAGPVSRWIEGRPDAEPIGANYRSSRQLIGALLCDRRRAPQATLEIVNGQTLYVRGREEPIYLDLRIPQMPLPAAGVRNSLPHYTELYTLWTSLHLLDGGRRILISVLQSPERLMKRFAQAFEMPGWEAVTRFHPPEDPKFRALFDEARAACIDYCGQDSYEARLLDQGIATSHGQMPQRLRRLMTELIDQRICPLTIATATLTEGVNLPFDIIFLTNLVRRGFDAAQDAPDVEPISTSEFRNLAGRAGRPGTAESIEGITLVALPTHPSTTADGTRRNQEVQMSRSEAYFNNLLIRLQADEQVGAPVQSPLATLIQSIIERCRTVLGIVDEEQVLVWLEQTAPANISPTLATGSREPRSQLGDTLDELDGFLLAANEELALLDDGPIEPARAEVFLRDLWQRTFTRAAAVEEGFMERCFIQRGRALVETIYPEPDLRKRLYRFGFTPHVGTIFDGIAPQLIAELRLWVEYGRMDDEARYELFRRIGNMLREVPGVGFKVRDTEGDRLVLAAWERVLGWWMLRPGSASPDPDRLRAWQRFVAENLEFRLGVAVGAAVAQTWGENAAELETPTLADWRATTGLPWIAFWFRELLRWGTFEPFVAFALAQGLAATREDALARRPQFLEWLAGTGAAIDAETMIDPQQFTAWQRSLRAQGTAARMPVTSSIVEMTGADGRRPKYPVRPIVTKAGITWIDAAGYEVARSPHSAELLTQDPSHHDFSIDQILGPAVYRSY